MPNFIVVETPLKQRVGQNHKTIIFYVLSEA